MKMLQDMIEEDEEVLKDIKPMILVIAARMHAMQMGPKNGAPRRLTQTCFHDCTDSVAEQKLLALIMLFRMESESQKVFTKNDVVVAVKDRTSEMVITAMQCLMLLARYGDFTAVTVYVFDITHPAGASSTQPSRPPCRSS